jgi:hypothetical protein
MNNMKQLDHFIDTVMSIEAPVFNIAGGGIPGNAGSSVSQEGAINSGMDVTWELKQSVMELANACRVTTPKPEMIKLAKAVEGYLLSEQLLSVLNKKQVDALIDELQTIVKPE